MSETESEIKTMEEMLAAHRESMDAGLAETVEPPCPPSEDGDSTPPDTEPPQHADGVTLYSAPGIGYKEVKQVIMSCVAAPANAKDWTFLGAGDGRQQIDMDRSEFLGVLALEVSPEFVVAAGLDASRGETAHDDDGPLYVTFNDENRGIHFSTGEEYLFPMADTALDCALACNTAETAGKSTLLFICDSPESATIVKRVGLPAVSCAGLELITQEEIKRICGESHRGNGWRHNIVLLDFDVCNLKHEPTAAISAVIARLADAADLYRLDLSRRFGVCRLSSTDVERIKRAITFEDAAAIRQMLLDLGTAAMSTPIANWRDLLQRDDASLASMRAKLAAAIRQPNSALRKSRVEAALRDYEAALHGNVIQKLEQAMGGAADAIERLELKHCCDIASLLVQRDPLVQETKAVLEVAPAVTFEDHVENIDQQIRLMSVLRRLQVMRPKRGAASRPTARQTRPNRRTNL